MHRIALLMAVAVLSVSVGHSTTPAADWAINATAIEACSCPHFCMCYFHAHPAAHHEDGKTVDLRTGLVIPRRIALSELVLAALALPPEFAIGGEVT